MGFTIPIMISSCVIIVAALMMKTHAFFRLPGIQLCNYDNVCVTNKACLVQILILNLQKANSE